MMAVNTHFATAGHISYSSKSSTRIDYTVTPRKLYCNVTGCLTLEKV